MNLEGGEIDGNQTEFREWRGVRDLKIEENGAKRKGASGISTAKGSALSGA